MNRFLDRHIDNPLLLWPMLIILLAVGSIWLVVVMIADWMGRTR